jgi:hypothetical protein
MEHVAREVGEEAAQEGEVEGGAVEGDEHREGLNIVAEVLQVLPGDVGAHGAAVVEADNGDLGPDAHTGGLDVEVGDVRGKLGIGPPVVGGSQGRGKVAVVAAGEAAAGVVETTAQVVPAAGGESRWRGGAVERVLPIGEAFPPEAALRFIADAREMNEGLLEHGGDPAKGVRRASAAGKRASDPYL